MPVQAPSLILHNHLFFAVTVSLPRCHLFRSHPFKMLMHEFTSSIAFFFSLDTFVLYILLTMDLPSCFLPSLTFLYRYVSYLRYMSDDWHLMQQEMCVHRCWNCIENSNEKICCILRIVSTEILTFYLKAFQNPRNESCSAQKKINNFPQIPSEYCYKFQVKREKTQCDIAKFLRLNKSKIEVENTFHHPSL